MRGAWLASALVMVLATSAGAAGQRNGPVPPPAASADVVVVGAPPPLGVSQQQVDAARHAVESLLRARPDVRVLAPMPGVVPPAPAPTRGYEVTVRVVAVPSGAHAQSAGASVGVALTRFPGGAVLVSSAVVARVTSASPGQTVVEWAARMAYARIAAAIVP